MRSWWKISLALLLPLASVASCIGAPPGLPPPGSDPTEEDGGPPGPGPDPATPPDAGSDTGPDAEEPAEPDERSGSRLRLHFLEAGPGATRSIGFWDTDLDMACTFQEAPDGALRCLPRLGRAYFNNMSCAGQVVMLTEDGTCEHEFGQIDGRTDIYRRTATSVMLATASTVWSPTDGGGCTDEFKYSETKAWAAEPVPMNKFVQGVTEDAPRSSGMVARYVKGADGSRMLLSVHTSGGSECDFTIEPGRCIPSRRATTGGLFSDAACTDAVTSSISGTKPEIAVRTTTGAHGCPTSYAYFAVGDEVASGADLFVKVGSDCNSSGPASGTHYHVGASIDPTSFPEFEVRQEGTGRIRALRRFDTAGKPLGRAHAFWDSDEEVECTPARLSDGTIRCVPSDSGARQFSWFTDHQCSQSLGLGTFDACLDEPGKYITEASSLSGCSPPIEDYAQVFERGAAILSAVFLRTTGGICQVGSPGRYGFRLGDVVARTEFPELELKKD